MRPTLPDLKLPCNLTLETPQEPGTMTNSTESTCPKCGAPLNQDAPQGLCPKCVLAEAATLPESTSSPAGRTPPPAIEEIAPHFPDLEILELIGAGGMGAVYKARQPKLDRLVALKILSHDLSADPAFAERFNREARVLARLNHPHIVTVFDFGTAGPFCFLLMEYVDGVNLRQAMQAGGFTPADTLALVQDICAALKFAHEEGILHRDIKPENVLIDSRGRVKIADFGIAKLVGEEDRNLVTLTMHGSVLGSPHYMAPEQIETPGDVDQRADIYSLGVVFYELLTGELPIGRFAPPSEKTPMDPRVDEVVMRTLEKERRARYQTAGEVQTQVKAITRAGAATPAAAESVAVSAPAAQPAAGGAARFATASAIFTGISLLTLPLAVLSPLAFHYFLNTGDGRSGVGLPLHILILLVLLVSGLPAIVGFILGAIALGGIRKSGAAARGFGRAMFGTLTWPLLLLIMLTSVGTGLGLAGILGPGLLWFVGAAAITMVVGVVFLLAIRRWVLGGPDGVSWLLGPHTMIAAGIVLIPTLFALVTLGMLWLVPVEAHPQEPQPLIERTTRKGPSLPSPELEPGFE
jgi:tRNA A-37 threonylcarbamoyl transferase component Bud32